MGSYPMVISGVDSRAWSLGWGGIDQACLQCIAPKVQGRSRGVRIW